MNQFSFVSVALMSGVMTLVSCVKPQDKDNSSDLLRIQTSQTQNLSAEASTSEALCKYLDSAGYYLGNTVAAGTRLAYSLSYLTDSQNSATAEKGQGVGEIGADGFFSQFEFSTGQLALPPGAINGMQRGKSLWKITGEDGYLETGHRVACNTAATYGSRAALHPGYQTMKVSKVSFTASTAGQNFTHNDAVEVRLAGGTAEAFLYFAKGQGLVGMEFRETAMPSGTAKVYINRATAGTPASLR